MKFEQHVTELNCWMPLLDKEEIMYKLCCPYIPWTHTWLAHVHLLHMHTATHGLSSGCTTHLPAAGSHFALRKHLHICVPGRGCCGRQVCEGKYFYTLSVCVWKWGWGVVCCKKDSKGCWFLMVCFSPEVCLSASVWMRRSWPWNFKSLVSVLAAGEDNRTTCH